MNLDIITEGFAAIGLAVSLICVLLMCLYFIKGLIVYAIGLHNKKLGTLRARIITLQTMNRELSDKNQWLLEKEIAREELLNKYEAKARETS